LVNTSRRVRLGLWRGGGGGGDVWDGDRLVFCWCVGDTW